MDRKTYHDASTHDFRSSCGKLPQDYAALNREKGEIKNACVPWDMLVLSVMTLSVDLLRQIATDPHGFSRAHSIGNGLFNFPQGAVPFPRYASVRRRTLLVSAGQINTLAELHRRCQSTHLLILGWIP